MSETSPRGQNTWNLTEEGNTEALLFRVRGLILQEIKFVSDYVLNLTAKDDELITFKINMIFTTKLNIA